MGINTQIEVTDLHKSFGKNEVLKGITTKFEKGDVVCIIGPSGSGKSTFLRALNGLETATSGDIIIDGFNLTDKNTNLNLVRQNVGMVFQHFNLFPNMTVMQNITYAPVELKKMSKDDADKKAIQLLETVGLLDKKDAISGEKYKNQELHFTLIVSKVVVPTTSDNNSSKQSSTAERKNEQGKQTSKDSTTVDQPQEQETIKKEAIHKNEKPNSESNDTFKEVYKEIDSPLKLPLKMPTEISQMPQSSVVAINNEQSKYPNVSAHNLEIQVAGTAGIFAGGVVAIGTITGFNKFYKFLKIVKK